MRERRNQADASPASRRGLVVVLLVLASAIAIIPSATADAAAGSSTAVTNPPTATLAAPTRTGSPRGRLSPRLSQLGAPLAGAADSTARANELGVPAAGPGSLVVRPSGRILVSIHVADVSLATEAAVVAAGAQVLNVSADTMTITAEVTAADLAAVSAAAPVRYVVEVLAPSVGSRKSAGLTPPPTGTATSAAAGPVTFAGPACPTGVVSEGDAQLNAATARSSQVVSGAGVRVGVISDSYNARSGAATDVTTGDLPGAANPCGYTTPVTVQSDVGLGLGTDEGRAMLQIVHDLAPSAPLSFATAYVGEADYANQIRNLKVNGAKVIVDDVAYLDEPMYQDGIVANAINDVTAGGVTYVTAAGNQDITIGGKDVSSYEATGGYRPTNCPAGVDAGTLDCHDWDPGAGVTNADTITVTNGGTVQPILGWNEPQLGITTDLDLYLVDQSDGTIVAKSHDDNVFGTSQAFESFGYTNHSGLTKTYKLVVSRYAGNPPQFKIIFMQLSGVTSVAFDTSAGGDLFGPALFGHSTAQSAAVVAAVPFNDATRVESFSSRGPARTCWGPVSGAIAAAAIQPCLTKQPDIAATDGGQTSFFSAPSGGISRFYGTSAAAPHAAAVVALQRQKQPCRSPGEIITALKASGRPVGSFGATAVGSGLIDAVTAISSLQICVATVAAAGAPGLQNVSGAVLTGVNQYNIPSAPTTPYTVPNDFECPTLGYVAASPGAAQAIAPNSSTAGLDALASQETGPAANRGCIDVVRSALPPRNLTGGDKATFEYYAFAFDAVTWASPSLSAPGAITVQQLRDVYSCQATNWSQLPGGGGGQIKRFLPAPGTDLYQLFVTRLLGGVTPAGPRAKDTGTYGSLDLGCPAVTTVGENLGADPLIASSADYQNAILPYSSAAWVYQATNAANPTLDRRASARLGGFRNSLGVGVFPVTWSSGSRRFFLNSTVVNDANPSLTNPADGSMLAGVVYVYHVIDNNLTTGYYTARDAAVGFDDIGVAKSPLCSGAKLSTLLSWGFLPLAPVTSAGGNPQVTCRKDPTP